MQAKVIISLINAPLSVISYQWTATSLSRYLRYDPGADGLSAFPHRESYSVFHGYRGYELDVQSYVISGHDHLGAGRKCRHSGNVRGPEVKLRAVAVEER